MNTNDFMALEVSVARVIRATMIGTFVFFAILISGKANAQQYGQQYNPCEGIFASAATDAAVGAVVGALLGGDHRGARMGAGGAGGASYAMRRAQCESFRQQEYYRRMMEEQRAQAVAVSNAPRCSYSEHNGVQSRSCTETVYGEWRR